SARLESGLGCPTNGIGPWRRFSPPWLNRASPAVGALSSVSLIDTMSALKKSLHAAEQKRADVARARRRWIREQGMLDPARLVFIDETATSTNMVRLRGRCPRGERLIASVPHGHWKTITFVAGLRHDGIVAPFVIDGAMNGPIFLAYIEQCLAPTFGRRDIVIMDNLPTHKVAGVIEAIEALGASVQPTLRVKPATVTVLAHRSCNRVAEIWSPQPSGRRLRLHERGIGMPRRKEILDRIPRTEVLDRIPRKEILDQIQKYVHPFRITKGEDFRLKDFDPAETCGLKLDRGETAELIERGIAWLTEEQDMLYAQNRWSLLLVFQAMDAAGKDSTIKHVMSGVNPQGCQVVSFKQPSSE